ncbi:MAG: hypothetical protein IJF94_03705 [Eubacterium sp.]|nr:hypothetical protein [Eubacterium sp.]
MIDTKVCDFHMHRLYTTGPVVRNVEADSESADVIEKVIEYLGDDGFHVQHPDKNYLRCAFISPCHYPYWEGEPSPDDNEYIDYFEYEMIGDDIYRFRLSYGNEGTDIFFVPNISIGEAISLAATYKQHTFIYKDVRGCREVCSKPFYKDGKLYEISDVVKEILTYDTMLNNAGDVARVLNQKIHNQEINSFENGKVYDDKNEYEFYYISEVDRTMGSGERTLYRNKYLLHHESKDEH